jgi:hypothetical protein
METKCKRECAPSGIYHETGAEHRSAPARRCMVNPYGTNSSSKTRYHSPRRGGGVTEVWNQGYPFPGHSDSPWLPLSQSIFPWTQILDFRMHIDDCLTVNGSWKPPACTAALLVVENSAEKRLEVYPGTRRALERRIDDVQHPFSGVDTAMNCKAQRVKK